MTQSEIERRHVAAEQFVAAAAELALKFFHERDTLRIETKGLQDWVSAADRDVERAIRQLLEQSFPDDGIIGEEHAGVDGSSGYVWVIDPIDGTTNFVNGLPGWCVVLACVHEGQVVVGVITDPVAGERFSGSRGHGARGNGHVLAVSSATSLADGSVAVGHNMRVEPRQTLALLEGLLAERGMFYRNGSGALMLAYVAAGRLIGYSEPHMNAWDCLAALLLIEEAGGLVQPYSMDTMLERGGRVVAGPPGTFEPLCRLSDAAFGPPGQESAGPTG